MNLKNPFRVKKSLLYTTSHTQIDFSLTQWQGKCQSHNEVESTTRRKCKRPLQKTEDQMMNKKRVGSHLGKHTGRSAVHSWRQQLWHLLQLETSPQPETPQARGWIHSHTRFFSVHLSPCVILLWSKRLINPIQIANISKSFASAFKCQYQLNTNSNLTPDRIFTTFRKSSQKSSYH